MLLQTNIGEGFWRHLDFWIGFGLGVGGIIIGWLAFLEARKAFIAAGKAFIEAGKAKDAATAAKDAANKAGKTVKKQSMLLAISETTRVMGQIRQNTNYEDANSKLMEINGKVRNIMGFYREELGQNHQNLLQQIEASVSDLLTEFNLVDPEVENSKVIYNKIRQNITNLAGHLNELQGVLENELILNN
jgi:hypothetical protein